MRSTIASIAVLALGGGLAIAAARAADDPVVAVVNGAQLHRSDLAAAQQLLPQQYRDLPLDQIYDPLLERMIDGQLMVTAARKENLQDDPAVKAEMDRARDEALRNAFLNRAIDQGTTPERLQAAYNAAKSQPGFASEEVHALHILVADENEAKDLIAQLGKGADFAALAKEKSTDPSAKTNGGDLGYFRREMMVPEFSEAAFALKPGTIDPTPVHSQFGWHVIKVVDRRTAVPSFEEKQDELRQDVARNVIDTLVADLQKGAQVQRFGIDGSPAAPK